MNEPEPASRASAKCPHCGAGLTHPLPARCPKCKAALEKTLIEEEPQTAPPSWWSRLLSSLLRWYSKTNKITLLLSFLVAAGHFVLLSGDLRILIVCFVPLLFAMTVAQNPKERRSARVVAFSFLILIEIGINLAPFHTILPGLHDFTALPQTESRLLTWYLAIYLSYIFLVLPPYLFVGNLWRRRVEGKADLSRFTCYLGLATWMLILPFMPKIIALLFGFGR